MIRSILPQWRLNGKRVFLRADLNVPIKNGTIDDDFRLVSILPTLDYIIKQNGSVVLATHIGEPHEHETDLSTQILLPWFKQRGYSLLFESDSTKIAHLPVVPHQIILLENLRFFPGEKTGDPLFAKQLATTAQYYVNDAFGTMHRTDCSIVLLPYEFPENKRSIGFLVEKELHMLEQLQHPPKPFIALLGGSKIADKIPLIQHLLDTTDALLICPALCFSFLAAQHKNIGSSLTDPTVYDTCKKIMHKAMDRHIPLIFPLDYQIADTTQDGPLSIVDAQNFPHNGFGISIGPKTIAVFNKYIQKAQTIFFNGAMGFTERPETLTSTYEILSSMAHAHGTTYVAGGDSVKAVFAAQLHTKIDHLSTGGGAALAYISGKLLPGLAPFEEE